MKYRGIKASNGRVRSRQGPIVAVRGVEVGRVARRVARRQRSYLDVNRVARSRDDREIPARDIQQAPAGIGSCRASRVIDVPNVVASAVEGQRAVVGKSSRSEERRVGEE